MKRYPNPWVVGPAIIGGILGGSIAYALTACSGFCGSGLFWGTAIGLLTAIGFGTVAVLADRSIGEWREATARGLEPPSPGCEVPEEET